MHTVVLNILTSYSSHQGWASSSSLCTTGKSKVRAAGICQRSALCWTREPRGPACDTTTPLTFDGGVEMRVFVQDFHLLAPVELVPPVGHHLLQVVGVEAVVESCPFQRRRVASLVEAVVQVLQEERGCPAAHPY